ncbi:MAG TPA: hypothetical protein VHT73_12765 [Thermodesulfobacteriota bacterium]|nr:hypothetical protein [Thermodesulfobacteriota bacterium]
MRKLLWYLPGAILVIIACVQILLVYTEGLSPWWGGGFGMFSTTDAWGTRHIHAFAIRPGIRREIRIPRSLEDAVQRVLTLPTESNMYSLAIQLSDIPTPDPGPLEAIEIQVWATHFDSKSLQPRNYILRSSRIPIGE